MKKIDFSKMERINGGSKRTVGIIFTEAACFGAAFSFGLVTFGLGLVVAVGCSAMVAAVL